LLSPIYRKRYSLAMSRTTVVLDEALVRRVMRLYRLPTKRAAIDFALRALVGELEELLRRIHVDPRT
jgi:Arc/MetJ family transcription regulator